MPLNPFRRRQSEDSYMNPESSSRNNGIQMVSTSNSLGTMGRDPEHTNSSIFSMVMSSQNHLRSRWSSFRVNNRSFWTKYCLLCTACGSAATILAAVFLIIAVLFRYYTTSTYYFETVPTYIPAILLSICGVSTIAFSCKRNRNIILLRITACWSLVSAAISSVITITTSLIHMNRLQTLKECVYNRNPPSCTCFSHSYGLNGVEAAEIHYIFENTPSCDVIHGVLYSCLRAVFAISVVAVLLSIFLCMLLYQLIGHERKKAYWSRIRRINSDWSAEFIACLARPMRRDPSSMMPLMMSPVGNGLSVPPIGWGPPPPYEEVINEVTSNLSSISRTSAPNTIVLPPPVTLDSFGTGSDSFLNPHPFSPTITSVEPVTLTSRQTCDPVGEERASASNSSEIVEAPVESSSRCPPSSRRRDHAVTSAPHLTASYPCSPVIHRIRDVQPKIQCDITCRLPTSSDSWDSFQSDKAPHDNDQLPLSSLRALEDKGPIPFVNSSNLSSTPHGAIKKVKTCESPSRWSGTILNKLSKNPPSLPCSPLAQVKRFFSTKSFIDKSLENVQRRPGHYNHDQMDTECHEALYSQLIRPQCNTRHMTSSNLIFPESASTSLHNHIEHRVQYLRRVSLPSSPNKSFRIHNRVKEI